MKPIDLSNPDVPSLHRGHESLAKFVSVPQAELRVDRFMPKYQNYIIELGSVDPIRQLRNPLRVAGRDFWNRPRVENNRKLSAGD